jgi:hypothetical protein
VPTSSKSENDEPLSSDSVSLEPLPALLPAANWVLELLDARDELQTITIYSESIISFQELENVAKAFVTDLKGKISRRFFIPRIL